MKIQKYSTWLALPLMTLMWVGSADAVSVDGTTVTAGGSTSFAGLPLNSGRIEYFIPLSSGATGTYGEAGGPCGLAPEGVGTCADYGSGEGYANADALKMNIYFNLSGQPAIAGASLDFVFDDLDLIGISDPPGFHESMKLSYWDGSAFQILTSVIDDPTDMKSPTLTGGTVDSPPNTDPITWSLDLNALDIALGALNIMDDLNDTRANNQGFWIQLGFGSEYKYTRDTSYHDEGDPRYGKNTEEFLTATLNVSPVPLPSAVWLFGSALIGFIGMSRRTRV